MFSIPTGGLTVKAWTNTLLAFLKARGFAWVSSKNYIWLSVFTVTLIVCPRAASLGPNYILFWERCSASWT